MATKAPLEILRSHRAELQEAGVKSLKLFGSVVRGEAGAGSDLDILVEFSRPVGVQDALAITQGMNYEKFSQDKRTLKAVLYIN